MVLIKLKLYQLQTVYSFHHTILIFHYLTIINLICVIYCLQDWFYILNLHI